MKLSQYRIIEPLPTHKELEEIKGMILDILDEETLASELTGEHHMDDHIDQDESGFQDFVNRRAH